MIKHIFADETFFFTSDPPVSLLNVPSIPDDCKVAVPASQAVTIFGGKVSPTYDPQTVTAVIISPQKVPEPSSLQIQQSTHKINDLSHNMPLI